MDTECAYIPTIFKGGWKAREEKKNQTNEDCLERHRTNQNGDERKHQPFSTGDSSPLSSDTASRAGELLPTTESTAFSPSSLSSP